jgi:hypothetical protein
MTRRMLTFLGPAVVLLIGPAPDSSAQPAPSPLVGRTPVLTGLSPPGVQIGGRETWTLVGRNLAQVDRIDVEGDGIEVTIKRGDDRSIVAEVRAELGATPGFRSVRVEGPDGYSNLRVVRVDRLGNQAEHEPNDTLDQATPLPRGFSGAGELKPQDIDHFLVDRRAGEKIAIEVEARRLGVPVAPVVTVMTPDGRALFQGRETPGVDGDCRFLYTVPSTGPYVIQVRDNLYRGGDGWCYRLRVSDEPFATGLFPLGGPPGRSVTVTASGGNLSGPVSQTVKLPNLPGAVVDLKPFDSPAGKILAPGRLVVGEGPEANEPDKPNEPSASLADGGTINGRIDRPGEVDRYRVRFNVGETVHLRVVAAPLGSWLDSVVTVRDPRGTVLAENDDPTSTMDRALRTAIPGLDPATDSRISFKVGSDQELTVEVSDRFGRGGPEYAYRLSVGSGQPDFAVFVPLESPFGTRSGATQGAGGTGTFNLEPGRELSVPFLVVPEGWSGSVAVRAEDLPAGVSAAPVNVRAPGRTPTGEVPAVGALTLVVNPDAARRSGRFRVVARATLPGGRVVEREAAAAVSVGTTEGIAGFRPVVRWIRQFPLRILGPIHRAPRKPVASVKTGIPDLRGIARSP